QDHLSKGFLLNKLYGFGSNDLECRNECRDQLTLGMHLLKKSDQVDLADLEDAPLQVFDHIGQRDLFTMDLHLHFFYVASDDLLENGQQVEDRGVDLSICVVRL